MLKAECEELLKEASEAVGELNRTTRHFDSGYCLLCHVARGKQHVPDCPTWPLVLWRQKYNDARQAEKPEIPEMDAGAGRML